MEAKIYNPVAYKSPGVYNGAGGIYKGRGVYNDGSGGVEDFVKIGGKEYPVVTIGSQKWIGYNLDYAWKGLIIGLDIYNPCAVYYDNNENIYGWNGYKCGLLYNSHAVEYLEQNKNELLPNGWRVPYISDFQALKNYIDDSSNDGYKLSQGDLIWAYGWQGTNDFLFSLLPNGQYSWNQGTVNFEFILIGVQATLKAYEKNYCVNRYNGDDVNNQFRISPISNPENWQACYGLRLIKDA